MERSAQVDGRQARLVRLHAAEIPELATDFIEAVGRAAFDDQAHAPGIVRHAQLAVLLRLYCTDDDNRPLVKKARISEKRRDVRRAARRRLRPDCRGRQSRDSQHP